MKRIGICEIRNRKSTETDLSKQQKRRERTTVDL